MKRDFLITGMTCAGCAAKVQSKLAAIPGALSVSVDLESAVATVESAHPIEPAVIANVLSGTKYGLGELQAPTADAEFSLRTYYPLALVIGFITLVASITSFREGAFDGMGFMARFMAGFFLAFSFFKLLDLRGFAESYAGYDLLAMRWKAYGFISPFIDLALGSAYLVAPHADAVSMATIIVMGFSLLGVLRAVLNKQRIRCACLGTVFNLPMSTVTIAEDALMIAMATVMLA
ncbi:MAG: cation transporter [Flavobacteriales bacterium]|nr:cation transporter [Flavobacteriales bacterium]